MSLIQACKFWRVYTLAGALVNTILEEIDEQEFAPQVDIELTEV